MQEMGQRLPDNKSICDVLAEAEKKNIEMRFVFQESFSPNPTQAITDPVGIHLLYHQVWHLPYFVNHQETRCSHIVFYRRWRRCCLAECPCQKGRRPIWLRFIFILKLSDQERIQLRDGGGLGGREGNQLSSR